MRHNTALLEQAVALVVQRASIGTKQAEAEAAAKLARAVAHRRVATGAAIAAAAIGIGLGFSLGLWKAGDSRPVVTQSLVPPPTAPATVTEANVPQLASIGASGAVARDDHVTGAIKTDYHDIVADYPKFATQTVDFRGRKWQISAGHQYAAGTDKIWTYAWCYGNPVGEGLDLRVDLARRENPASKPMALLASRGSLVKAGIDDAVALELATKCPWLDERTFRVDEFAIPIGRPDAVAVPPAEPPAGQKIGSAPLGLPLDLNTTASPTENFTPEVFVAKDGYDSPGSDLPNMPVGSDDQQGCENTCRGVLGCSAYTFNKSFRKCFLKSATTFLFADSNAVAGYRTDRGPAPRFAKLQMRQSKSLAGDLYRREVGVRYIDCLIQCETDSNCIAFSHDFKAKVCLQFKSTTSETDMPNVSSGVKTSG